MKRTVLPLLLSVLLMMSGCAPAVPSQNKSNASDNRNVFYEDAAQDSDDTVSESTPAPLTEPESVEFTERDLSGEATVENAILITLNEDTASCVSDAVTIEENTIEITKEGVYVLSGTLNNGSVVINTSKQDKVGLVLNNASIHSETSAPIFVKQADKVFITLAESSQNTLSNGGVFENDADTSVDAVIFSKDDITLNGTGSLTVQSPAGHGIVSKDDLVICGGSITVFALAHGFSGKDQVKITDAALNIESGKDGIHAENKEDESLGGLYIESGIFTVRSEGDCLSAASVLQINDGTFDLISGGGSENAEEKVSEGFGMEGGMMPPGGMGGKPSGGRGGRMMTVMPLSTAAEISETEESISCKGIKGGAVLNIFGGRFTIDSADDAIHSNGDLLVNSGNFSIETGDDGFHADAALLIDNANIEIKESYEGLEGLSIRITGGDLTVVASDDGLNAAGGTDRSGFGGMRGGDVFAADPNSFIEVSGGTLYIKASGDGIDSNGSLSLTGGSIILCGPTMGDTAVLDYASTGSISGASFIGTGSSMMAQSLSSDTQGVIGLNVGNQSAGTTVTLTAADGEMLFSVAPEYDYSVVIFSCPEMKKGEHYTVTIGSVSKDFTAN